MKDAKQISTHLASHFKLSAELPSKSEKDIDYMSHIPYSNVVGIIILVFVNNLHMNDTLLTFILIDMILCTYKFLYQFCPLISRASIGGKIKEELCLWEKT